MCNAFTMLVATSDWRYVAQCEHKTVHLRWDHLTISLPPQSFLTLARQILREVAGAQPLRPTSDATVNGQSSLRLRLHTVLLEFSATDLPVLTELMQQAIQQLSGDAPATPRCAAPTPLALQPIPQPSHFALAQHLN
ncbi:MAG: hypothetical protein KDE19_21750 [Caldilineaceae bacterium]|nr:hypothetical protein [Caldilineaceae bacterium]